VLGDVMLDEFVWGDVTRVSPEAPVPVVNVRRESVHLGGAANVLANLISLGARGCVIGVVGDDAAGERIRTTLRDNGTSQADDLLIVDSKRPTTTKTRIIAHNQMVVRADRERRMAVDDTIAARIVATPSWFPIMTRAPSRRGSSKKYFPWLMSACPC
jgi:D-beta-D-heptose 7-phosphate kinase/D-beta-D-heptose 1-phosphate adenosyltransferase